MFDQASSVAIEVISTAHDDIHSDGIRHNDWLHISQLGSSAVLIHIHELLQWHCCCSLDIYVS